MKCMKFLLFAFNFVFWILGICVMAVGIWTRVEFGDFNSLLGDSGGIESASNILIAAGCMVMIIGFVGCCGAWKENKCLLLLYFLLVLLIFILEIAAGIMAYRNRDKVTDAIKKNMEKAISEEYGQSDEFTKAVDEVQKMLSCCGAHDPSDWKNTTWKKPAGQEYPKSCYEGEDTSKKSFTDGCVDKLIDYIKKHTLMMGGVGVGIAVVQILGMIFAICLYRSIGYEKI